MKRHMPILVVALAVFLAVVAGRVFPLPTARADSFSLETYTDKDLHTILSQHATFLDEIKADFNLLRADFLLLRADYLLLQENLEHHNFAKAVLAEGTNANTLKTTVATFYTIDGVVYTKAATDNIAMTAATAQAISTYRLYLVSLASNAAVTVTAGTATATDTAVLPALPASSAPLGYFKVVTDGVTTFTSGTTDLGAAGLTVTYVDLAFMNSGPAANTATSTATSTTIDNAAAHTTR